MPRLNTIDGYYDPLKFIKKNHTQEDLVHEKELIEYLNSAYRHALRKILLAAPASFAEASPIYELCIDFILNSNDLTQVTVKGIEEQINKNKDLHKLKNFKSDNPDFAKLQLIKAVTRGHQANLVINEHIISYVNSTLILENILNKEYNYGFFATQKSDLAHKEAVSALKEALKDNPTNLLVHLSTLRKGHLGSAIRVFVKQGLADKLLHGKTVHTVSDFITALHEQVNLNLPATAGFS
ncbi:hypothetical protein [Legionella parisiensis]|uniref:hypothetical protein n=1 Tax=Legionella parisiensis TaxID=45071 RepID=UPI000730F04F|nr:hypothetical protein [Legionella parisiensis]KTD42250.1 hypothetical protein Lpar_3567 [Legionella parisiensis]STX72317.1 Uncharacterised protein [Legionella parisiensis]